MEDMEDEEDMEDMEDEEDEDEEDMEGEDDMVKKLKDMGEAVANKKPKSFLKSVTGMMSMEETYRNMNKNKKK